MSFLAWYFEKRLGWTGSVLGVTSAASLAASVLATSPKPLNPKALNPKQTWACPSCESLNPGLFFRTLSFGRPRSPWGSSNRHLSIVNKTGTCCHTVLSS